MSECPLRYIWIRLGKDNQKEMIEAKIYVVSGKKEGGQIAPPLFMPWKHKPEAVYNVKQ